VKLSAWLAAACLALLLGAGALHWLDAAPGPLPLDGAQAVVEWVESRRDAPIRDLSHYSGHREVLLDPAMALPRYHRVPYDEARALHRFATTCGPEPTLSSRLRKALA